jgi:hypothetical protein
VTAAALLYFPCCTSPAVLPLLYCPCCTAPAVLPLLYCPCCTARSDDTAQLVLLEALAVLLAAASTQLHTQETATPRGSHPLLEALMAPQQPTGALAGALLSLAVAQHPPPTRLRVHAQSAPAPAASGTSSGVMRLVRSAAGAGKGDWWGSTAPYAAASASGSSARVTILQRHQCMHQQQRNTDLVPSQSQSHAAPRRLLGSCAAGVMWLPMRTYRFASRVGGSGGGGGAASAEAGNRGSGSPLGDLALTVLLVLVHYPAPHAQLVNGVREGLAALRDVGGGAGANDVANAAADPAAGGGAATVTFARLYAFFAAGVTHCTQLIQLCQTTSTMHTT